MGVWDLQAKLLYEDSNPYDKANKDGFETCSYMVGITPGDLVEGVEARYRAHPEHRNQPAFAVLTRVMLKLCQKQINEVRAERGLTLLNFKR